MSDNETLLEQVRALLNKHSRENRSNTPDFILASFLMRCLYAYEDATQARDTWYAKILKPGKDNTHEG